LGGESLERGWDIFAEEPFGKENNVAGFPYNHDKSAQEKYNYGIPRLWQRSFVSRRSRTMQDSGKCVGLFLSMILCVLSVCINSNAPKTGWQDLGLQIVPINRFTCPDSINTTDTLVMRFWSREVYDAATLSRFDLMKDSNKIEITAWADVKKWIGAMAPPPTDLWPLDSTACVIPPPFQSGALRIVVHQPDGTVLTDTIYAKIGS
jgi:hypothetical protein